MQMDYVEKNKAEYSRLENILKNLNESTWRLKIGDHWNVGTMLWHLAFWDQMTFERLRTWKIKGILAPVPDTENIGAINASFREISNLLDLKNSMSFILKSAENIDEMVRQFNPTDIEILQNSGKERWFMRYKHRSEHLDRIEKSLNNIS